MARVDPAKVWSVNYRLLAEVIASVGPEISALGVEMKELFLLAALDEHPYPAELAATLCMPKPTVTVNLKRIEAAGLLRRQIDTADLRRHRLVLTPDGRKVMTRGMALLSEAFATRLGRLTAAQQSELQALLEAMSDVPVHVR
ncbi:MAG: MarR family winged helix-turn-helix transcriptional regulator [Vicinamibacterales bacterium]